MFIIKHQAASNDRVFHSWTVIRILVLTILPVFMGLLSVSADDRNPLKLPVPLKDGTLGSVVLHGGGSLSDEIVDKFIELAGGKQAKIVLIPSGSYVQGQDYDTKKDFEESTKEFEARLASEFPEWISLEKEDRIESFRFLYSDNQDDADDDEFVAALHDATGVWIPAAYQGKLSWRFTHKYSDEEDNSPTLFQRALRDVVARGGVVGGLGGGMAALPEVMIKGLDRENDDDVPLAKTDIGLGLFGGAIVDQNFNVVGGRIERLTGLLKDTKKLNEEVTWPAVGRNMIGLAVEQETAIIARGSTLQLLGENRGHLFLKGNGDRTVSWHILSRANPKVDLTSSSAQTQAANPAVDPRSRVDTTRKNPFGMPEPENGAKPGMVVLHGGGSNADLMEVFPSFAGVQQPRLVHCPAASPSFQPRVGRSTKSILPKLEKYFFEWVRMQKEGRLTSLDFMTTSMHEDADDKGFVLPLTKADAVWISGGDQRELARLFINSETPTLVQKEVIAVVARGGVVGGSSAGTAVMAKVMTVPGETDEGEPADPQISCGLGVLKNVIVEQHYKGERRGGRLERFTSLLLGKNPETNQKLKQLIEKDGTKFDDMIGLAIEEQTALLLQENRLRIFGKGHAHVFLKSADQKTISWHELEPGDSAFIYFCPVGPILELDDWRIR